jgi:hypothetical protein
VKYPLQIATQSEKWTIKVTSEVLILNKHAIVLGADSAVTTSGSDVGQSRYSKSANKIFEITQNGNVAATIYGNSHIDLVPWELAIKLFRRHLGKTTFSKVSEYSTALLEFLKANDSLFPPGLRSSWVEHQFDNSLKLVVEAAKWGSPELVNADLPVADRALLWAKEVTRIRGLLTDKSISNSLTQSELDALLQNLTPWVTRAQSQIDTVPALSAINATELAELGHMIRYFFPEMISGTTGVVIAGYGEYQIFPAYEHLNIYGHIGGELSFLRLKGFEVTHGESAMIQPLAQASMINMFTDGFSPSLEQILSKEGEKVFASIFTELASRGIAVDHVTRVAIVQKCHPEFMLGWKRENWAINFNPLLGVIQNLSVQEMAHLAESLLGLESLKERVTSASESVGGPIDVAAITKSEGLVWIKRKHYFDASLNMRYVTRLERSFD